MATIINGKEVSAKEKEQVAEEVKQLKDKGIHPGLAVVIVGEDPASKTYVKNKKLACQAVGIHSEAVSYTHLDVYKRQGMYISKE